ncbi:DUF2631 domain-containing protein [Jongsikchunia kroppenstedtii]|uniref:DUF2631 domain-containing protein n=1 Tax=Jongsikchunia kroppenstedtii TaxID=1121721 RepID=UPI00037AF753|nr:DUF2631 domain-containing protein [Jongsikchunia kroppenstedtii]
MSTEVQHAESELPVWKREPIDAPSARFGWHGESPAWYRTVLGIAAVGLLLMLVGNQKGHVEDIYLVAFAIACILWIMRSFIVNRGKWKR